jgi:glycosyltransferase involved in cell wall biosynthesis
MGKIKIIELNYHCHDTPLVEAVLQLHHPSSGYAPHLLAQADMVLVKHLQHKGAMEQDGVRYRFFSRPNRFWQIPLATHRFIKKERPDVVLVQGFVFPLQAMALRAVLGKKALLIAQHHGEQPWGGIKGWMQRQADRYIAAYTFTALGNARPWLDKKIIAHSGKCFEVLEAAPLIQKMDRAEAQRLTGMDGSPSFLWAGRLNANKDPLTVLAAFAQYLRHCPAAKLYMVFQEDDLLGEVRAMLQKDGLLQGAVQLVGRVAKEKMAQWYSAADYYVSASHSEGSGYALLEAMHCGCIPVVSRIPSFETITEGGRYGVLFGPGDAVDLLQRLQGLETMDAAAMRTAVLAHAQAHLTHRAIAGQLLAVINGQLRMDNG